MELLSGLQALIVDDHRQMRMLVRSLLRAAGIAQVAEAQSAGEALQLLGQNQFDLMIVDWQMSPLDGITLTQNIRREAQAAISEIPIVMLTAHTERSRVAAARDAGVHGLVRKPISTRLLLERVSAALTDQRKFVRVSRYCGPDRRHGGTSDYIGPFRRAGDPSDLMLDDAPMRAAAS